MQGTAISAATPGVPSWIPLGLSMSVLISFILGQNNSEEDTEDNDKK